MARRTTFSHLGPLQWGRRLVDLLGPTGEATRQSLVALAINSVTSLAAGAFLGAIVGTFEELPGLLVMVPAAIGLRGNIFSTFGNRISTAVHAGSFTPVLRRETLFGQNVLATMSLTVVMSLVLAVVARVVALAFGVENAIGVLELVLISLVAGVLASLVVLGASVLLAVVAVRRDWDLDNLVAPSVSTLGDVVTIPCLFLASLLVGTGTWTLWFAGALVVFSLVVLVLSLRSKLEDFRRIVIESIPVLTMALVLSTLAGVAVEKRTALFAAAFRPAGTQPVRELSGIARRNTVQPHQRSFRRGGTHIRSRPHGARGHVAGVGTRRAITVSTNAHLGAQLVAMLLSQDSPGVGWMLAVSLTAGLVTMAFVVALAYYGTIAAWRVDLDPDSVGIPVVTASVDFVGAVCLVAAVVTFGLL